MFAVVRTNGRFRRPRAAIAHDRAMPQWRLWLARGHVSSLRNPRQPSARCDPPAARYADLEVGSGAQMPGLQDAPLRAAGAYDQADQGAADRALSLGASRR